MINKIYNILYKSAIKIWKVSPIVYTIYRSHGVFIYMNVLTPYHKGVANVFSLWDLFGSSYVSERC